MQVLYCIIDPGFEASQLAPDFDISIISGCPDFPYPPLAQWSIVYNGAGLCRITILPSHQNIRLVCRWMPCLSLKNYIITLY